MLGQLPASVCGCQTQTHAKIEEEDGVDEVLWEMLAGLMIVQNVLLKSVQSRTVPVLHDKHHLAPPNQSAVLKTRNNSEHLLPWVPLDHHSYFLAILFVFRKEILAYWLKLLNYQGGEGTNNTSQADRTANSYLPSTSTPANPDFKEEDRYEEEWSGRGDTTPSNGLCSGQGYPGFQESLGLGRSVMSEGHLAAQAFSRQHCAECHL